MDSRAAVSYTHLDVYKRQVLKVGDTVLYGKYAGTELEVEGTKYLIMRQSDVLAVLGVASFRYPEADTMISSIVWAGQRKMRPLQKSLQNRGSAAFVRMVTAGCGWF